MDLVEAESEEDLHRDPTISSPILRYPVVHCHFAAHSRLFIVTSGSI
jgi:hypothetical protein